MFRYGKNWVNNNAIYTDSSGLVEPVGSDMLFGILSFLASIITLFLIDETMNKSLDNTTLKEEIKEFKEVKEI